MRLRCLNETGERRGKREARPCLPKRRAAAALTGRWQRVLAAVAGSLFVAALPAGGAEVPFGKRGEPIRVVAGFNPYFAPAWTLAILHHNALWKRYLPAGSTVELRIGLRGPAIAKALGNGELHFAYFGDAAVTLGASRAPDVRLVAVTSLSQDLCVVVARRDAPRFSSAREGARWLHGKRIATTPGTCQGRIIQLVIDRERIRPARIFDLGRESLEAAFRDGRIDAAGIPEPGASDLIRRGLARRLVSSRTYGEWDASFVAASAEFLRARPDIVDGWLRAELDAQRLVADPRNADEIVRILAPRARLVSADALRAALYARYREEQGGAEVRLVLPFAFSAEARAAVSRIHSYVQALGLAPPGPLRGEIIERDWTERILAKSRLASPLGAVRATHPAAEPGRP